MHTFPASQEENCFQKYNLQVNVKVLFLEKVHLNQIELNSITVLNKINLSYALLFRLNNAFVIMQLHIRLILISAYYDSMLNIKDPITANI